MEVTPYGHALTFLPDWFVLTWRILVWITFAVEFWILVKRANSRQYSSTLVYGRVALGLFMAQSFILTSLRFGQEATIEGLPLSTLGLIMVWITLRIERIPPTIPDRGGG